MDHLKNIKIPQNCILVSFDVTSLYTKLSIKDSIKDVEERLKANRNWQKGQFEKLEAADNRITERMSTKYIFPIQKRALYTEWRLSNGFTDSGTVADIYSLKFENDFVSKIPGIIFWKRYVDDVFAIIEGDDTRGEEIRKKLNSRHPEIQFTNETEKNKQLAFLDILIIKYQDGNIETKVHRKGTHTNRYLNFNSFHHRSHKISVMDSLAHRAFKICHPKYLEEELGHIK